MATEKAQIRKLDLALRDSFSRIKEEVDSLRGQLEIQSSSVKEIKQGIEIAKKDFVGLDKINVLKIKLGDLREEVKSVERTERKLKELQKTTANKDSVQSDIEELKAQLDNLEKSVSEAVKTKKVDDIIKEVNEEFSKIRKKITAIEQKGGSIVRDKLGKLEYETNKKSVILQKKVDLFNDELKKRPSKQDINKLLREVNTEFDEVNEGLEDVKILRNDLKIVRRDKISKRHFNQQMKKMAKEIDDLKKQLARVKTGSTGINFYWVGNIFIIIAFLILAGGIVLFFTNNDQYVNYLIIAAVISFVLGVILRIVSVIKN